MFGQAPTTPDDVRLSELVSALSYALDLVEGHAAGHAVRTALISLRLATELDLSPDQRSALLYATLLKDAGSLTTTARLSAISRGGDTALERTRSQIEWFRALGPARDTLRRVAGHGQSLTRAVCLAARNFVGVDLARELMTARCRRGASVVFLLGLPDAAANAILSADEHWDGGGLPTGLRAREIPLLARIMGIAQAIEDLLAHHGVVVAREVVERRRGTSFDPALVDALIPLWQDVTFWQELERADVRARLALAEPEEHILRAEELHVDLIAEALGTVIDAKSPYTYRHSEGVAALAVGMADLLGFSPIELRDLRRAALLHDVGKLGIPNRILDKRGPLTTDEARELRQHPAHTHEILSRIGCFRDLAEVASSHHERLDGTGYHRGLTGDQLSPAARVLAVADVAEALSAERSYHAARPQSEVLRIMAQEVGTGLCPTSFAALTALFSEPLAGAEPSLPVNHAGCCVPARAERRSRRTSAAAPADQRQERASSSRGNTAPERGASPRSCRPGTTPTVVTAR